MGVFQGILGFLTLLPYIVSGAEQLHAGKSGAEKKSAVMQLAAVALQGAAVAAPGKGPQIAAAAPAIGNAVDAVVGVLNALGVFGHASPTPAAAPAP